jgi:hypothetical protein
MTSSPLFISEEALLKLQATHKLRVILQREKQVHVKELHRRCAVGLSTLQFDEVVEYLISGGWCSRSKGPKRGTLLVVNEQWSATELPLEVVCDEAN